MIAVLVLQPLVGFLLVPVLIRNVVVPQVAKRLDGIIALNDAAFNPYTWHLTLDGLTVKDPEGHAALGFARLDLDFNPLSSLFLRGWRFNDVVLTEPYVDAIVDRDAGLNLVRLLRHDSAASETDEPSSTWTPRLIVGGFEVREGRFHLDDRTFAQPIVTAVDGVSFRVERLDTTAPPVSVHREAHSSVITIASGATIEWSGTLTLDPPVSIGSIVVRDLVLPDAAAHVTRFSDATVESGTLTATVSYHIAPLADPPVVRARVAHADVTSLVATRPDADLVAIPRATLTGGDLDAVGRTVHVDRLALDQGELTLDRDAEGTLNLARMIRPRPEGAAIPPPSADRARRVDVTQVKGAAQQLITSVSYILEDLAGEWSVSVQDLDISGQSILFTDHSTDEPVRAELRSTSFRAGPVRTADGFDIPFEATGMLNGAASEAKGTFSVTRRSFEGTVGTTGLALAAFAPYARLLGPEPFASLEVEGGALTAAGDLRIATPDPSRIEGNWTGDLDLTALATRMKGGSGSILGAHRISIEGAGRADVHIDSRVDLGWNGNLRGAGCELGPALLSVMGLGNGDVRAGELGIAGAVEIGFPEGQDAEGTWDGRVEFGDLRASNVAGSESRTLDGSLGGLGLDVRAQLTLPAVGGANATWTGVVSLDTADVTASGAAPAAATLGAFSLTGEGAFDLAEDGQATLSWDGASDLRELSGSLSESQSRVDLASAGLEGALSLAHGDAAPIDLAWNGRATLGAAHVQQGTDDDGVRGSNGTATFEGSFGLKASSTGVTELTVDGTLDTDTASLDVQGERPVQAALRRSTVACTASARLDRSTRAATWTAEASGEGFDVRLPARNLQVAGTGASLTGTGEAAVTAESTNVRWKGAATAATGTVDAPDVAGGLTATYESLAVDGDATVIVTDNGISLTWTGDHDARTLRAEARDVTGPAQAQLASSTGRGTLLAAAMRSKVDAAWTGSLVAQGASGDLAQGSRHASAARAELSGKARATVGDDGPTAEWIGDATAHEVHATSGDGADRVRLDASSLVFDGHATLGPVYGRSHLRARGSLAIERTHAERGDPVDARADLATLTIDEAMVDEAEREVSAKRIELGGLVIEGTIKGAMRRADEEGAPETSVANDVAAAWNARVGELTLTDGTIRMLGTPDGAEEGERQAVVLDQIRLDATDMDTRGGSEGTVRLEGRVAGSGVLTVEGTIDPFSRPLLADLVLRISSAPLPPTNPYASRYVGWQIDAGRLSTEIPTSVRDGKLTGTLHFTLDGIRLGERAKSPDAPDLPLDFALAVMRDSNDRVKGSIPFSGDATSPEFSLTGIIVDVILTFIAKVATAPFQLLASAFEGAEDVDLSSIPFEPGSSALTPEGLKAVDILGRALAERPGLTLVALGHYAPDADGRALRMATLRGVIADKARRGFPSRKTVTPELYIEYVDDLWGELPEGKAARASRRQVPFEEKENALLATVPFADASLLDLARARADSIVAALLGAGEGGVAESRLRSALAPPESIEQERPMATLEVGAESPAP